MMIDCRRFPPFSPDDLGAVRAVFQSATPIHLGQAWRQAPEPGFAPAVVRTGWRTDTLLVFAELTDQHVVTDAQGHNERFWELGDTFEMFLQPADGLPYVELHVTPNNQRLQLRFSAPPSSTAAVSDPFKTALVNADLFQSRTWINPDAGQWCVFAAVPASVVRPHSLVPLAGSTWRFSFSRYDHSPGHDMPVISSSSPHVEPAFHRPHEWGTLHFA